jgi:hypothetical protein
MHAPARDGSRRRDELLTAVNGGETVTGAARRLGIPRATVYSWKSRDAEFGEALSAAVRAQRPVVKLAPAASNATLDPDAVLTQALAEHRLVALVATAARSNWRAASWLLEKRYPALWGAGERERDAWAEASPKQRDDLARLREIHRAAEAEAQS